MFKEIEAKSLGYQIKPSKILNMLFEEYSGILAGGTALALSQGITVEKHLQKNRNADIDVYFPNQKLYYSAVNKIVEMEKELDITTEKSATGLCYNIHPKEYFDRRVDTCKIQLVGCVFGRPEEVIESFDFRNLGLCYYMKAGKYVQLTSSSSRTLAKSTQKLLDIRHNRSPFLMHRIYKYITYRGFSGVTDESRPIITDWIMKACTGYYHKNTDLCPTIYIDLFDNHSFRELIDNENVINDADLSLLIGQIKEDVFKKVEHVSWRGYSTLQNCKVGEKDFVVEQIKKRGQNENRKEVS